MVLVVKLVVVDGFVEMVLVELSKDEEKVEDVATVVENDKVGV